MFFHVSTGDGVAVAAIAAGVATVSGGVGMLAAIPASQPLRAWLAGDRSDGAASEAWEVAVDLPWLYQRAGWRIAPFAVAVGAIAIGGVLHINATATLALFVGGLGVGVVGNVVALLAMDAILAPVRGDIGAHLGPEVLEATPRLPIGARLISSMIAARVCWRESCMSRRSSFQTYTSVIATSCASRWRLAAAAVRSSCGANVCATHP